MEKGSKVDQLDPIINNRLADLNLGNSNNNGSVNLTTNRCSKCGSSTMKRPRLSSSCLENPNDQELIRNKKMKMKLSSISVPAYKKKMKLSPISIPSSSSLVNSNLNSSSQSFLLSPKTVVSPSPGTPPKTNIIFLGAISSSQANPKNPSPIQPTSLNPDSPFWWISSRSPSPSPPSSVSSHFSPSFLSPSPSPPSVSPPFSPPSVLPPFSPPSVSPPFSLPSVSPPFSPPSVSSPPFSPPSVSPPFSPPSVSSPPVFSFLTPRKPGKELIPSALSTQLSSPRMEGATANKPNCFLSLSFGCGSKDSQSSLSPLPSPTPSSTAATENEGSKAQAVTVRPCLPPRAPPIRRCLSDPYSLPTTTTTAVAPTPFNSNDQMNQNSACQNTVRGGHTPPGAASVHNVVRYGNAVQEHIRAGCKRRFSPVLLA
ncbi:proline-rich receptor-like protein kinase PERK9 [Papaver somniferum]|uniref:proline-rich receptor-like protein kinase PERK9 n=1 Tax=Papaver somniferum TaxID=3469 RepID=UPI000E6F5AD7|nr:proline-rich receptor-like protein kinase PERK9 [Papaver somniferum]